MLPEARRDGLLVQDVDGEVVVYDQDRHRIHRLNRTAALIWRRCDGRTAAADLAAAVQEELGPSADEAVVRLALDRLHRAHLLTGPVERPEVAARPSRRAMVRRLAKTAGVFLLPVVVTLAAPTPAAAQSPVDGCTGTSAPCPGKQCPGGRPCGGTTICGCT